MRIGVDVGGTKMEAIALDSSGKELIRQRVPTIKDSYENIVDCICALVASVETRLSEKGSVGVGIPGTLSRRTNLVKNANTTELIGHPLGQDLSDRLDREVRVANDANCFALSEATDGAASGASVVFGVIIGTGVGGGIVVDGKILTGPNSIAGEWGHNPLPWANQNERPGPECYCGKKGCIETFLSGPGLSRSHNAVGGDGPTAVQIAALADQGDEAALKTLSRYERRLAKALCSVINLLDPDVIVFGGGVSNIDRLYKNVPPLLQEYAFTDSIETTIVKAKYGDSSGVRGAAWLWPGS